MRVRLAAAQCVFWLLAYSLASTATPPKLAVLIVVDQMRTDYVDRFRDEWSGGFKRLLASGAWFSRAAYPYLTTVTCPGHATIATGTYPNTHGVFQNAWFDRNRQAFITCTEDASVQPVGYGKAVAGADSGAKLLVPTFAEEMHRQRGARVVSISMKARSAIMLAGRYGDAVTWLSDSLNAWQTSSAYSAAPVSEVAQFIAANPIEADFGKVWDRQLPERRYAGRDAGLGEAPPAGWSSTFPHALQGKPGESSPSDTFHQQWERSPFADAYLGRMAAALVESMKLGAHGTTDVLAVSFASPDLVGHAFGPRSHEVEDTYLALDRTLGTLLDRLDALVGRDQYVVALSSDHGVAEIPEQARSQGRSAGRISPIGIGEAIEAAATKALGPGKYVSRVSGNDVYLQPGVFEKLTGNSSAMRSVLAAAASRPGILKAFRADHLAGASRSPDRLTRAAALSYAPGRSGDLILAPKPGWMFSSAGTTHGSANPDDQRVPIMFFGKGIRPGTYTGTASPADIAPTLAAICGATLPLAEGAVLREALAN